ncbi:MAG: rhomboid family intramembrane serine protease [Proteobacteria bacterium]|nr:rhomboid family intramembrane serine protease [Pseudomonadota bacterium]
MSKPAICHKCRKLIGIAKICPYCFAVQSGPTSWLSSLKRTIGQLFKNNWQDSFTSRVLMITVIMFIIELLATLILAPTYFFQALLVGPRGDIIMALGASSPMVFRGHWWSPLTAIFLHGGVIHLGFNLMALSFIAQAIERISTAWFFVFTYLISGALGFLLSAAMNQPSIGASGALFGLIGCGMVISYLLGLGKNDPMFVMLLNWAIMGLLFGFVVPGIDNWAHIGGLVGGAGCGWLWSKFYRVKAFKKAVMWLAFLLCLATAVGWVTSIITFFPILFPQASVSL